MFDAQHEKHDISEESFDFEFHSSIGTVSLSHISLKLDQGQFLWPSWWTHSGVFQQGLAECQASFLADGEWQPRQLGLWLPNLWEPWGWPWDRTDAVLSHGFRCISGFPEPSFFIHWSWWTSPVESLSKQCQQLYFLPQAWQCSLHASILEWYETILLETTWDNYGYSRENYRTCSSNLSWNLSSSFLEVGFLGYTGAGEFDETLPHLEAACTYFAEVQPEVIFLLGHWNNEGLGCTKRMSVPEIHETLMQIPGCSGFGRRKGKRVRSDFGYIPSILASSWGSFFVLLRPPASQNEIDLWYTGIPYKYSYISMLTVRRTQRVFLSGVQQTIARRLKYMDGHEHCNVAVQFVARDLSGKSEAKQLLWTYVLYLNLYFVLFCGYPKFLK